jgi:hypothetical protein
VRFADGGDDDTSGDGDDAPTDATAHEATCYAYTEDHPGGDAYDRSAVESIEWRGGESR